MTFIYPYRIGQDHLTIKNADYIFLNTQLSLRFVKQLILTESRFAFMNPLLISTEVWLDCDVSSPAGPESCSLRTLSGYCLRSASILGMPSGSSNQLRSLPFSALFVKYSILSSPYSPHANSITGKREL